MAKSKSSEVNHLRGVIKKLKKNISRQRKHGSRYEESKEVEALLEEEMEERQTLNKMKCPKCTGVLDIIDGAKLKVFICQDCDYKASKRV